MDLAINEAKIALSKNEVPVGSVIINNKNQQIISKAHNLVESNKNPLFHAEIIAINNACKQNNSKFLYHHDLYITLEPCYMCLFAISLARIENIFYALDDNKMGAISSNRYNLFHQKSFYKPEIFDGIRENEVKKLMKDFFSILRKKS